MHESADAVTVHTFGLDETGVLQRLGELATGDHPLVATSASDGIVTVHVRSPRRDVCPTRQQQDDTATQVEQRLGPFAFGRGSQSLAASLVMLLADQKRTLVTAESCTGGWVGKLITDVPGASGVYLGGWVVYANEMKTQQLGVPAALIRQHGVVSQAVAVAMATGAIRHSGSDLAVAVTGIAGPGGGVAGKPVGTVWLGVARAYKDGPATTGACLCRLPGDRATVRRLAAGCAMQLLRFTLLGVPVETFCISSGMAL